MDAVDDDFDSCSIEGSTSTARRSFSPRSGSSNEFCDSEKGSEDLYGDDEEDEYSSESEDEGESNYKPGGYHRVKIGEIYNTRFEVLEKLGWGHFSTVWKCLDRQTRGLVAMKVQRSAGRYTEAANDEIKLLECTVQAAEKESDAVGEHEAISVIRMVDSFTHKGPNGVHVCIVFEMMGDNLLTLIKYYNYRGVPMPLVQRLTRNMMEGLAFLHDKCQIIHTDLKPENVLLSHHIPQLPKIRKSQWEAFRTMRLGRRQKVLKITQSGAGGDSKNGSVVHEMKMSKEEKKRLKKRLKKKRQKLKKRDNAVDRGRSVDDIVCADKINTTDDPTFTSPHVSGDALSNKLRELSLSTVANINEPFDDIIKSNFVAQIEDTDKSMLVHTRRTWYHRVGQLGDEEDKNWVHLPPEFAARVMLLLPEGRVAGSKRKEREFTLKLAPILSMENGKKYDEDKAVETSFALRYLNHVDDAVTSSIAEQVLEHWHGSAARQADTSRIEKYRIWRLEFDARYTHAVLDYLERRVEGLWFLNLATSSGLALPGFFLPKPRHQDNQFVENAMTGKVRNDDHAVDIVLQGMHLPPEKGEKALKVKPLEQRLGRWVSHFNALAKSKLFDLLKLNAKICDLGNACWTSKHFTNDIQTRHYRCPEVILNKGYDTPADIWSMACFVFELLTGDLLFDPKSGRNFTRDEDHLAQMIELLGHMPKSFSGSQRGVREFFNRKGNLKHIRNLKFWSLQQVLVEKYHFSRHDAECLASFLGPMLRYDPTKRATAQECLGHPWLAHGAEEQVVGRYE